MVGSAFDRRVEIARHVVVEHRHVAGALHVRLAAQRVDAAARLADVAEQELQDRERPDPLHAGRVLRHPERVEDGPRPVLRHRLRDLLDLIGRNAGDPLAHLQRVARDEGLQAREDAVRVVQALGDARLALRVELVSPGLRVVLVVLRVEPAEDAVLEVERLVAQEEGVGVGDDVVLVVQLVDDDVVDHRVLERRVGAGPDARVDVGRRRGPGESRIDVDDLRAVLLGLPDPLEGHGVVLGDVAAFHQDRLAVLQVDPVVGHRSPTERGPQTGDRGAMSKSGLVLDVGQAEQPGRLLEEVALLVRVLRAAHEADRVGAIDRAPPCRRPSRWRSRSRRASSGSSARPARSRRPRRCPPSGRCPAPGSAAS